MYIDRFNPNNKWQKVLFRPDKKTQAAELNEIQSLINYQHTQSLEFLLYVYKVIKGLKINIESFTSTGYILSISPGQVFVKQENRGYFLDTPFTILEVNYNTRAYIVINIDTEVIEDIDEFKEPLLGNITLGELGANRLVAYPIISNQQDGYPVALIEGQNFGQHPYIFYYNNKGYSLQYSDDYISSLLEDYIALRLYEESGDFIAEGLNISFSSSNHVSIFPGSAYIKGKLIKINNPYSYKIKRSDTVISFYLNNLGYITYEPSYSKNKINHLYLGFIEKENSRYYSISSNNRALTNSDLKLIKNQTLFNRDNLINFLLNKETYSDFNSTSSGVIVDSFINLNGSDIYSLLFNSTIVPEYKILRPSLRTNYLTFNNLTVTNLLNTTTQFKNGYPYALYPTYVENIILSQPRATSFLTVNPLHKVATLRVSPANGIPKVDTQEFKSLRDIEINNSNFLSPTTLLNTQINLTLEATQVTLEGFGFNPFEDNLSILFGNVKITEFEIIKGSFGSQISSIKTSEDGSFIISFLVPNLPLKEYAIRVYNSTSSATTFFRDTESALTFLDYSNNIAQSFTIDCPVLISKVNLALRTVPNLSLVADLAIVSIVSVLNDLPTSNVIGQSVLKLSDCRVSSDGSILSPVNFDIPILLSKGNYAIVISSLINNQSVEFYYAEVGKQSFNSLSISDVQPLSGGELSIYSEGEWTREISKDLTFELVQAVPISTTSEINLLVQNDLGRIDQLQRKISTITNPLTIIEYFYKSNNTWVTLNKNQLIENDTSQLEISIKFKNVSNLFSIILLDNFNLIVNENSNESTWVSKTIRYEKNYKNVEAELECFIPEGSEINVYFSSNSGETWQIMEEQSSVLVNANIPLFKKLWSSTNLDSTTISTDINGISSRILRNSLTIRIDFISKDSKIVPYVRNLKSIAY